MENDDDVLQSPVVYVLTQCAMILKLPAFSAVYHPVRCVKIMERLLEQIGAETRTPK